MKTKFICLMIACSNLLLSAGGHAQQPEDNLQESVSQRQDEVIRTESPKIMMQGGYVWVTAELDKKGTLFLFYGARATAEQQGVDASFQIRAYDAKNKEVWISNILQIPSVCGRLDNSCRSRDEDSAKVHLSKNNAQKITKIEIDIFER